MVILGKSAFNVIIGRPTLQQFGAITSFQYLKMKFPTDQGVGEVQGTQALTRSCYTDYLKDGQDKQTHKGMMIDINLDPCLLSRGATGTGDEVEEVVQDPEQPKKKLTW